MLKKNLTEIESCKGRMEEDSTRNSVYDGSFKKKKKNL